MYGKKEINKFFSEILGVSCVLARFPAGGSGFGTRHSKAHMQKHQRPKTDFVPDVPGTLPTPPTPPDSDSEVQKRPILLSNESPILAINRASLDALNEDIIRSGGKPASASVFRANVVLASATSERQEPYSEDHWTRLRIGRQTFQMLGSCRRCHMICVDQDSAEKNEEPFVTLVKTRRFESKIFFGSHMCHIPSKELTKEGQYPTIRVGEVVLIES
jgi:molybdenum cofactor sulfurtransferase